MKYYRLSWNDCIYGMTYRNLLMLMAVIPDPDMVEQIEVGESEEDIRNAFEIS